MSRPVPIVLLDTNVLLDLMLAREPWAAEAAALLDAIQRGHARGMVAPHTVTTLHDLVSRGGGRLRARDLTRQLLALVQVAPVSQRDMLQALDGDMPDFEDAVLAMTAEGCGARWIATRNLRDFSRSPVPAVPPGQLLALLVAP